VAGNFWRVEEIDPGRLIRLRAEMLLPGRAWLEMSVGDGPEGSVCRQRAVFLPRGAVGAALLADHFPVSRVVFGGMARNIASAAQRAEGEPGSGEPGASG
jgi:hypothetical protein